MPLLPSLNTGVLQVYEKVVDVIANEPTPAVVATVNMTQDVHGQVLRPGSILFPSRSKKTLKKLKRTKSARKSSKGEAANVEFTTTMGTKVNLPLDCAAGFSTQVKDVKLYLQELLVHLTLPVEVKCFAHQKSRHCKNMSNITLTETKEEASITGGLTMEGEHISDEQLDLPLDLPVQVACVDLTKEDLQEYLYSRVKSTYESIDHRLATNWKVVVNGDACDKAQQEFYASIRTDMAQDVVTVDLPERIYEEVGLGAGMQCPESAPKSAPPLPPHCKNDSKEESYVHFMKVDSDNTDAVPTSDLPAPPRPPKPRLDSDSSNGNAKHSSAATDISAEPTLPQDSQAAPQVPTPPSPPLLPQEKVATDIYEEPTELHTSTSAAPQVPTPPLTPQLPLQKEAADAKEEPTVPHNKVAAPQVPTSLLTPQLPLQKEAVEPTLPHNNTAAPQLPTPPPTPPLSVPTGVSEKPSVPQSKPSAPPIQPKVHAAPIPLPRKTATAIYDEPSELQDSSAAPIARTKVAPPTLPRRKSATAIYDVPLEPQNGMSPPPAQPKARAPPPPLRKTPTVIYDEPSELQGSSGAPPVRTKPRAPLTLPRQKTATAIYDVPLEPENSTPAPPTQPKVRSPPPLPLRKTPTAVHNEPLEQQIGTRAPPATASKPTGLGNLTAALRVLPPLSAQDVKKTKHAPPVLHGKPKQPKVSPPPQKLPKKPEAIYDEIQLDTSPPTTNTPLAPDRQLPPAPAPKPAVLNKPPTQPQPSVSQTPAEISKPDPASEEDNVKYLKTLGCNDIIRLIEAMELRQYIDCFMKVS